MVLYFFLARYINQFVSDLFEVMVMNQVMKYVYWNRGSTYGEEREWAVFPGFERYHDDIMHGKEVN
jgi:hypothetical protein